MYHGAQSINLFPHVIGKVVRLSKRVTHSIRANRYAEKAFFKENFSEILLKSKNARWLSSLLCKADFSPPHLRQSVAFSWTHFRFIMWAVRCFITSANNSIVIFQANAMENTFNGEHFLFK